MLNWVHVGDWGGQSSTWKGCRPNHYMTGPAVWTGALSCCRIAFRRPRRATRDLFIGPFMMSRYWCVLTDPSQRWSSPTPAAQNPPHTIVPPPPNLAVLLRHSGINLSPFRRRTSTGRSLTNEKRLSSVKSTLLHCWGVQFRWTFARASRLTRFFGLCRGFFAARQDCSPLSRCLLETSMALMFRSSSLVGSSGKDWEGLSTILETESQYGSILSPCRLPFLATPLAVSYRTSLFVLFTQFRDSCVGDRQLGHDFSVSQPLVCISQCHSSSLNRHLWSPNHLAIVENSWK